MKTSPTGCRSESTENAIEYQIGEYHEEEETPNGLKGATTYLINCTSVPWTCCCCKGWLALLSILMQNTVFIEHLHL